MDSSPRAASSPPPPPPLPHYYPRPFVVSAQGAHTHTLILLHGRGDTGPAFGSGFYIATPSSGFSLRDLYPGLKFVFPTTALRYSTVFQMRLSEWFDVTSLADPEEQGARQRAGLRDAVAHVDALIAAEVAAGIPEDHIFLGGLSQGAATALHVLLAGGRRLAGCIGMSGWLPFAADLRAHCALPPAGPADDNEDEDADAPAPAPADDERSAAALAFVRGNLGLPALDAEAQLRALETPVFLGHGDRDPTVNYRLGRNAYVTLAHGLGMNVVWKRYRDFGHWYKVGGLPRSAAARNSLPCLGCGPGWRARIRRAPTNVLQVPDEIDDIVDFWGKCGLLPS